MNAEQQLVDNAVRAWKFTAEKFEVASRANCLTAAEPTFIAFGIPDMISLSSSRNLASASLVPFVVSVEIARPAFLLSLSIAALARLAPSMSGWKATCRLRSTEAPTLMLSWAMR